MRTPLEIYDNHLAQRFPELTTGETLTISTMIAAVETLQEIAAILNGLSSAVEIIADRGR